MQRHQQHVITEIVATERSYLADLRIIQVDHGIATSMASQLQLVKASTYSYHAFTASLARFGKSISIG
jgi:hypothetical protein